jgi:amino acid transporter
MASGSGNSGSENKRKLSDLIKGPARDLRDPGVLQQISLAAFLAWVGLGSDGLSSVCYGPEEAFIALGSHQYLAVFLAMLMALTVFVISASYSQTISLFPTGGGGYLVATRLLGKYPGVVSGAALVVDYVLTIAISIASGADAIFSFLPVPWHPWKLWFALAVVAGLVGLNLRGVKESVVALVPVFLSFVVIHIAMIVYALVSRAVELPMIARDAVADLHSGVATLGAIPLAIIFLRAYSLGGGTYTGIEAVSNGLPMLREPRAATGKRTMLYMAVSLSFIAGGIILGYLLVGAEPELGRTLNAVMFNRLVGGWQIGEFPIGMGIVTFALLTEAVLLFVAAQTGFIGGPQVLATMATDRWLPRRLANLSGRLVIEDGVLAMALAAAAILFFAQARVKVLVVLYAINVFVTFTLSQLGMSVHWWKERRADRQWKRKLAVNGLGCVFTAMILVTTLTLKFNEGGWVTVLMTGGLIAACFAIRRHYERVGGIVRQLEADILPQLFAAAEEKPAASFDRSAPTAVLLVNGFSGLGLATLVAVPRLFEAQFRNVVFVSVGEVDSALLKGREQVEQLEQQLADDLSEYCRLAADLGFHAELRAGLGTDSVVELYRLCLEVAREFPRSVFFAGKLVFEQETFLSRFLHNHTALELQNLLQERGLSLMILPVRVSQPPSASPAA